MPKLTGPFMSLSASGTLAKTLTASIWKGQPYMRLRVIPKNTNTTGQQAVRSILGTMAKACRAVLTASEDLVNPGLGSQFFVDGNSKAPAGQSWISYLQKVYNASFGANVTAYGALDVTHKGYWTTTAGTLGLSAYTDKSGTTHTAGELLYHLAKYAVGYLSYTSFATTVDAAVQIEVTAFGVYVQDPI